MQSAHGGREYERLQTADGRLILQLHAWDVMHHHGSIGDPNLPPGNGVLIWIEIDDFDAAAARAAELQAQVVLPKHRNPPHGASLEDKGGPNHWEFWIRDLAATRWCWRVRMGRSAG